MALLQPKPAQGLTKELVEAVRRIAKERVAFLDKKGVPRNAQVLDNVVDAWVAGTEGRIPSLLAACAEQARRESDPEYVEYIRLRAKFGES